MEHLKNLMKVSLGNDYWERNKGIGNNWKHHIHLFCRGWPKPDDDVLEGSESPVKWLPVGNGTVGYWIISIVIFERVVPPTKKSKLFSILLKNFLGCMYLTVLIKGVSSVLQPHLSPWYICTTKGYISMRYTSPPLYFYEHLK